ncbi:MAG: type I restriction enzyme HsdR N-terminal domain-containing protein [Candidatus Marinimicrobia bacterium]|nr:type I restriction enzyme HsdR N-terminal domain-containing protein [Candidatus Neomarinimicrobiota bacterium]
MVDLKETTEIVLEKMKKFRSLYEQNEMAVRDQIMNPMLRGLGWNTENPEEVQPNVYTEEGIPDYSLLKNEKKVLFIEAKKLSIDIEKKEIISQLAKYCFGEGMRYGVLSNGATWILFRAFQEGTTMAERIVWKVDIENEDITASIRRLSTISKDNIENVETLIKKLQILDEIWRSLLEEPKELIVGLIPVFENVINEGYPDYEFNSLEIEDFIKERVRELISTPTEAGIEAITEPEIWEGGGRPRKMKIGKDISEIRSSYEILINTADWLIKQGKLKPTDCPIGIGYKRNLINKEPKHKYGESFRAPKKLSNGLWIEVHYSTAGCINNARRLLEKFRYSGSVLEVE